MPDTRASFWYKTTCTTFWENPVSNQLVLFRLRLVEAAVEFGNPEVNQLQVANLALCLDVLKLMRC